MNADELVALSYRDLQKLAKSKNIKAKQPKDALIKAILEASDDNEDLGSKPGMTLNASAASSIFTEDGKSEAETDEEEPKAAKATKRKLSNSTEAEGSPAEADQKKPKRRRFAEFYSAPRTSSPVAANAPKHDSGSLLNVTIDLDKSAPAEDEEKEVVVDETEAETENRLDSTITFNVKRRTSVPRKSVAPLKPVSATPNVAVGARKSLLGIPLRKNLVGTPGSVRKARPSAPMSVKKVSLAANAGMTPAADRRSLASARKSVDTSKTGKYFNCCNRACCCFKILLFLSHRETSLY